MGIMADTPIAQRAARPALRPVERVVARVLPSLADVIFVLCLGGIAFVLQGRALGRDGDIGWHIRLGLRTLAGDLPRADTFSSTAYGRPLVGMEWLSEVCYAAVWRAAGLNGVAALAAVLIAATAAGLLVALRQRHVPLVLALPLTLLALALTSIHWVARPHLFSLPLTLWWSEWLWRYWRDGQRRRLWYMPPVMVLWTNLHGGFLTGILLLGTAVAVSWLFPRHRGHAEPRALTATLGACLLATLVNPWGWAWPSYFAAYFADPLVTAYTQELQSPDFHTLVGRLFLALVLLLAAAWIFGGRGRVALAAAPAEAHGGDPLTGTAVGGPGGAGAPEPLAWAIAGLWTVLACTAIRAVPLWALVVVPLLGEALTRWLREAGALTAHASRARSQVAALARGVLARSARLEATERQVGRGIWSALALLLLLVVVLGGGRFPGARQPVMRVAFSSQDFPVAAVEALHRDGLPPGRGFNTVEWGGYLIYALPEYRVFIDSRSDFYGQALLQDYLTIMGVAPGWQRALDRYHVSWALLPAAAPLAQVLVLSPGWACRPLGSDGVAVLCVRTRAGAP
ncbi:MAG: hypothetical protein PVSMB4_15860 [Ktedonobacterales bacterium]